MEFFISLSMSGIDAAIPNHFIMLFRDMTDEALYKLHNRNGFFHVFVIFMAVVMESDKITIVAVNSGGGNDGASKIASDILHDGFRVTFIGFGIDVEAVFMFAVTAGFNFFKGRADPEFEFIEEGGTEGIA